jgi:protein ImuB
MNKPAELYACVHAKEFPAQALLRLRPELRDAPTVILEGEPPNQQVCSLNTKARLAGLRHGMTRVEVETFSNHTALPRCVKAEKAARSIALECTGAFSPRIETLESQTDLVSVVDIAGTNTLFGPPETLAKNLVHRLRSLGFTVRVAVSANFHAAICLAYGLKQAAFRVTPLGDESKALSDLPLSVLQMTTAQRDTFDLWGVERLGDLAALPQRELVSRLGQDGSRLHRLATGTLPHLFQPVEPPFALEEQMELDSPVELLDSLLFVLGVMLDQLILRAKARILALASVEVSLNLEGGGTHVRCVRPALPSADKQLWLKLLHLDLEAHPPDAAILALTLRAEPGSTSKVQLGLFSPQLPEPGRLDMTLARIRAIVGDGNVGIAALQDSHAAEAFRVEPFTVLSGDSDVSQPPHGRSAMRVIRPAECIGVSVQNGRPAAIHFRGQKCVVEHAYGPWLISGDWWTQTLWGCEQWDVLVRLPDGAMLAGCVVRDRLRVQWNLAGLYD